MNYSILKKNIADTEKKSIKNSSIVREEKRGTAAELTPGRLSTLSDAVRTKIQKSSVLEVIG